MSDTFKRIGIALIIAWAVCLFMVFKTAHDPKEFAVGDCLYSQADMDAAVSKAEAYGANRVYNQWDRSKAEGMKHFNGQP